MVAQKKRGAKKAAPTKAAQVVEEPVVEAEASEAMDAADDNDNGDTEEQAEGGDETGGAEDAAAEGEGDNAAEGDAEEKPEEKKEEKVETGKLLVQNLPSNYLFTYQEKLKELFSKYGEVINVKRGPIIVTELTTTPTLSAIVEFKNKESLDQALTLSGSLVEGQPLSLAVESRADTAVLVGVPYEASSDYVGRLFGQCGEVAHVYEYGKTKYKILRVTFHAAEAATQALKLDRELRINGFLVTVSKYRDDDDQKAHAAKNKRPAQQNRNSTPSTPNNSANNAANANNNANNHANNRQQQFRGRGGGFNARGNFRGRGGRGGFGGRGGAFPRGGFAPVNMYTPPQAFMGRPQGGFMNDGQRPNKRLRQM